MRKLLCLFVAFILVISVVACSNNSATNSGDKTQDGTQSKQGDDVAPSASGDEKVTLSYISWQGGDTKDLEEQAIIAFNESHQNIEIEYQFIPYGEYSTKLNTLMSAEQDPDVYLLQEYLTLQWGLEGRIENLTPYYKKKGVSPKDKYFPGCVASIDDDVYGVGKDVATIVLYYNKPLFEKLGIEPPPKDVTKPWTWEEFVDVAKQLTVDTDGNHPDDPGFDVNKIKTYGTKVPTSGWLFLLPILYSANDGSIATEDGKGFNLNSPGSRQVLQNLYDLMYVHKVAPTPEMGQGLPVEAELFKTEQLGMFWSGVWARPSMVEAGAEFGIAQLPMIDKPATIAWTAHYVMSSRSKAPDQAFEFLNYFIDPDTNPLVIGHGIPSNMEYSGSKKDKLYETYGKEFIDIVSQILLENSVVPENIYLKNFSKIADQTVVPALEKLWYNEASVNEVIEELEKSTQGMFEGRWDK